MVGLRILLLLVFVVSPSFCVVDFKVHPALRELCGDWQADYYYFPSDEYPEGARMFGKYTFKVAMDYFVERNFNATLEYNISGKLITEHPYQIRLTMNYDPFIDKLYTVFLTNKGNYKVGYGLYDWDAQSLNWTLKAQEVSIGVDGYGDQIVLMRKIDHATQEVTIYLVDPITNVSNIFLHGYEHRIEDDNKPNGDKIEPVRTRAGKAAAVVIILGIIASFIVFIGYISYKTQCLKRGNK